MHHTTIRATVSHETIGKVTRLFNGSLSDIMNELLQNARRAGASGIDISAIPLDNGLRITIEDDGCGIDDPARIVALGASSWNEAISSGEDPAGMGVFSLSGKHAIIESRPDGGDAWRMDIPHDAWTGDRDIHVEASTRDKGTSIAFDVDGMTDGTLEHAVTEAAAYYPLEVRLHGTPKPRKDFLAGAIHVGEWEGSRIGIFRGSHYHRIPTVNFHGLTISTALFDVPQIGRDKIHARIDIGHTPALQLVLPARKEFVQNDGLDALRGACEQACYEAIAKQEDHSLSFERYQRAKALGVKLGEAAAQLHTWEPDIADDDSVRQHGAKRAITGAEILMEEHEAHFDQAVARALGGNELITRLVAPEAGFAGYSWYDALRTMKNLCFIVETNAETHLVDEYEAKPPIADVTEAKAINLEFEIETPSHDESERERIATDLAFTFPDGCCSDGLEDVSIAYVRSPDLRPETLVDILERACFSAWNDSDADSWDTQHDRFLRDARELAYRILEGENAAIASQFRDAVARIMWTLPKGKRVAISFDQGSPIDVVVADIKEQE